MRASRKSNCNNSQKPQSVNLLILSSSWSEISTSRVEANSIMIYSQIPDLKIHLQEITDLLFESHWESLPDFLYPLIIRWFESLQDIRSKLTAISALQINIGLATGVRIIYPIIL